MFEGEPAFERVCLFGGCVAEPGLNTLILGNPPSSGPPFQAVSAARRDLLPDLCVPTPLTLAAFTIAQFQAVTNLHRIMLVVTIVLAVAYMALLYRRAGRGAVGEGRSLGMRLSVPAPVDGPHHPHRRAKAALRPLLAPPPPFCPRPYVRLLHEESKDIAGMLSQLPAEVRGRAGRKNLTRPPSREWEQGASEGFVCRLQKQRPLPPASPCSVPLSGAHLPASKARPWRALLLRSPALHHRRRSTWRIWSRPTCSAWRRAATAAPP